MLLIIHFLTADVYRMCDSLFATGCQQEATVTLEAMSKTFFVTKNCMHEIHFATEAMVYCKQHVAKYAQN